MFAIINLIDYDRKKHHKTQNIYIKSNIIPSTLQRLIGCPIEKTLNLSGKIWSISLSNNLNMIQE